MSAFSSLLTRAVMFFTPRAGAQACRAGLKLSPDLVKALSIYLLELGMVAAQRLGEFARMGRFLAVFGVAMPLLGAACGLAVGYYGLGLGSGGAPLAAVLGASASYIAVPPAVRMAIPEANPSLYLTLSLGITFPFNVVAGIPLYQTIAAWLTT